MIKYHFESEKLRDLVAQDDFEEVLTLIKNVAFTKSDFYILLEYAFDAQIPRLARHLLTDTLHRKYLFKTKPYKLNINHAIDKRLTLGESYLFKSLQRGDVHFVEVLTNSSMNLKRYGHLAIDAAKDYYVGFNPKSTPKAVDKSEKMQISLIKHGAKPSHFDFSPHLESVTKWNHCVRTAIARGQYDLLCELYYKNLLPSIKVDYKHDGPLNVAIKSGHYNTIYFLCNVGYIINTGHLMDACDSLRKDDKAYHIINLLIEKEKITSQIDYESENIVTEYENNFSKQSKINLDEVLEKCIWIRRKDLIELLIEKGANVESITPLLLTHLAHCGYKSMLKFLLKRVLKNKIEPESLYPALHSAAQKGHVKTVKLLIEYGVNDKSFLCIAFNQIKDVHNPVRFLLNDFAESEGFEINPADFEHQYHDEIKRVHGLLIKWERTKSHVTQQFEPEDFHSENDFSDDITSENSDYVRSNSLKFSLSSSSSSSSSSSASKSNKSSDSESNYSISHYSHSYS